MRILIFLISLSFSSELLAQQPQIIQPAPRSSCIEFACNTAGVSCSFDDDLNRIIQACRDVDTSCAQAACERGKECQFETELFDVLSRCKYIPPTF